MSMNMHNLKGHQNVTLNGVFLVLIIGMYQRGMEIKDLVLIRLTQTIYQLYQVGRCCAQIRSFVKNSPQLRFGDHGDFQNCITLLNFLNISQNLSNSINFGRYRAKICTILVKYLDNLN
jgi:hypothetical protein